MVESVEFQLGQITARLSGLERQIGSFEGRFDAIDRRLDAGSDKFAAAATQRAVSETERRIAVKLGGYIIGAAATLGVGVLGWLVSHAPAIAEWIIPPKH